MKNYVAITALLGAFTIILGAFGAHALKDSLTETSLKNFETAVRYQMYHVIVLLIINTVSALSEKSKKQLSIIFFVGILFFSGSIYCITLLHIPAKYIWFTTPLGGLILIYGWIALAFKYYKQAKN